MTMKFVIDRLEALAAHYGVRVSYPRGRTGYLDADNHFHSFGWNNHDLLNILDDISGIDTAWSDGHRCRITDEGAWWCAEDHNNPRYVGARVALHEQHLGWSAPSDDKCDCNCEGFVTTIVKKETGPPYFWLGLAAEISQ